MPENGLSKPLRGLYIAAMVNVAIWAIATIALVILLEKGGNPRGLFVILAGGVAVGIQLIATVSKLKSA